MAGWQADAASGTLSGWGTSPASIAQPSQLTDPQQSGIGRDSEGVPSADISGFNTFQADAAASGRDVACELFADIDAVTAERWVEGCDHLAVDGGEGEGSGAEDAGDVDSDCESIDISKLRDLLRDNAAFFEACEAAVLSTCPAVRDGDCATRPMLGDAEAMRRAINQICQACEIEDVDAEEAVDLFDAPMDVGVFYQFALEYFSALSRTVSMGLWPAANEAGGAA